MTAVGRFFESGKDANRTFRLPTCLKPSESRKTRFQTAFFICIRTPTEIFAKPLRGRLKTRSGKVRPANAPLFRLVCSGNRGAGRSRLSDGLWQLEAACRYRLKPVPHPALRGCTRGLCRNGNFCRASAQSSSADCRPSLSLPRASRTAGAGGGVKCGGGIKRPSECFRRPLAVCPKGAQNCLDTSRKTRLSWRR